MYTRTVLIASIKGSSTGTTSIRPSEKEKVSSAMLGDADSSALLGAYLDQEGKAGV